MPSKSPAPPIPISTHNVLHADKVVLWWMLVESPPVEAVERWCATLDDGERMRANRFHFAVDRNIYIAAHALTRALLAHVDGLPAKAWRFVTTPTGKPEPAPALNPLRLRFNLSHTRGLVACVAGYGCDLGVDVEADDRIPDVFALASRFFAPDEIALLYSTPQHQRRKAFFRIWTLKEAYIKAIGQGLTCPLDSFAFRLDPIKIRVHADGPQGDANWQFIQVDATSSHVISLAVRDAPAPVRCIQRVISVDEL